MGCVGCNSRTSSLQTDATCWHGIYFFLPQAHMQATVVEVRQAKVDSNKHNSAGVVMRQRAGASSILHVHAAALKCAA